MSRGLLTVITFFGALVFFLMTIGTLLAGLALEVGLISLLISLAFFAISLGLTVAAVRQLRANTGPDLKSLTQERSRLLRLAASRQGRLTIQEAAIGCHISIVQAEALLDDLVIQGTADTWISDDGTLVYVFRGLLDTDTKESAQDPMAFLDP